MKKNILKLMAIFTALILGASITACSDNDVITVGISQYGSHPSLDNCREGFLVGLNEEISGIEYDYQNANYDDNIAIQIASSFSAKRVDLMCAVATPSAMTCYAAAEDKDIPVIYTAITDPVRANLTEGNITGTSDKLPIDEQLRLIRALQPNAEKIGIVYTVSEANSISAVEEYKTLGEKYGFTVEAVGVTQQSEVLLAVDNLLGKGVELFSNLTDNNVVEVLPAILEKTGDKGVPVYGSEIEQVKAGCVAAAGIDYFKLGVQTGKMAARILRGEKASEIPYEVIEEYGLYINTPAALKFGIEIPGYIAEAAEECGK